MECRLTFLACASADGTEKFPLFIIGKSLKPRCFKGNSASDVGFDYTGNSKAWTNWNIFQEWLLHFNSYISRKEGRQVALLLDNASCYGTYQILPKLSNAEVIFFPPNTAACLQPMDTGVIGSLKRRYRRFQVRESLEFIESNTEGTFKIDQLMDMKWVRSIWHEMEHSITYNS